MTSAKMCTAACGRFVSALIALVVNNMSPLKAQDPSARPSRRWEFTLTAGGSSGGAATSFETAMSAEGFGDLQPCLLFCSGTISSPHSVGGEITRGLTIGYAVGHGWRVRAEWFSADLGETLGYHDPATWLFLHTSVGSLGLSGTLPLGDILRIGAGPSLNVIDITRTDSPGGPPSHVTRLGITLHGGLTFPARSRVFVEAQVHRALVGTADVGPFTAQEIGGTTQVTLTRTRVSFSYTAIRVGLGLRIQ